jgi:hypothetical protein
MLGGFGETKQADSDVQTVADACKGDAEELLGKSFNTWTAVTYQTKVVNGLNYKIQIKTDSGYVHLHCHKASSTGEIDFGNAIDGKSESDPL